MKKIRLIGLALLCFCTQGAWAQVSYIERSWNGSKVVETVKTLEKGQYTELAGNSEYSEYDLKSGAFYVVRGNAKYKMLKASKGAAANLILCDGATLTSQVTVNDGCSLNIFAQTKNSGTLVAKGYRSDTHIVSAGIGSDGIEFCMGRVTIHGGTIDADGAVREAAGIGGGCFSDDASSNCGNITIYAGTIKAQGGANGSGIGGGHAGNGGTLTIYGGTVTATGGRYGAGIGGGRNGDGGTVNIYGGTVTARGGNDAAGIGCGESQSSNIKHGGNVNIYGGTVKAYGGEYGAGIGGGQDASGAKVVINGGHVETDGGMDAAGIGSGEETWAATNTDGGSLTVNGGYVFADGTGWGAGIGGGEDSDGATVVINGGTVIAYAGSDAGSKNGSAIGSEDGDGHRGSLELADNLMVHAGQNPDDAKSHLFPFATRVPACFFRPYTRIEPCDHQGAKPSAFEDGISEMQCPYCCSGDGHEATGIESVETQQPTPCKHHSVWFTLDGRRLSEKPTIPGIYVNNGRKIVIK